MRKILLTGAGGFLGRQLLWHLKDSNDYFVYAVTSNPKRLCEIISANNIKILSRESAIDWSSVDIVVHAAFARTGISSEYISSLEYAREVFHGAVHNGVSAIINISSQSVYGQNPNVPWTEEAELMPNDLYGLAKASAEILLDGIAQGSSTLFTNLRLSSIMLNARFVNVFVQNAIDGKPINIVGGAQKVSFIDIRDAANGIISLINTSASNWDKIYNLGTGTQNSIVEIAEIVKEVAKSFVEHDVVINIEKKDISLYPCMDISKFSKFTNWNSQYDIRDMIKFQFEYLLGKTEDE